VSFLSDILESTKTAIEERERERPLAALQAGISPRAEDHAFLRAIGQPGISIIAEFKRDSPSHSAPAHPHAQVNDYVDAYTKGGARALSILTEESYFEGSLADLRQARRHATLPILRKDFVISEYQVYETAEAGADAVLLIVAALASDPGKLRGLYGLARDLSLDVLVEIRDARELEQALTLEAEIIGINNRNLETFEVDVETSRKLAKEIPGHVTIVSESGLRTCADLDGLISMGVEAALVGGALMDDSNPELKCRELANSGLSAAHEISHSPLAGPALV
jgi:indole-3-glycerol phosphate synthase